MIEGVLTRTVMLLDVQKPESWRLSCQTIVGDKSNSGKVRINKHSVA